MSRLPTVGLALVSLLVLVLLGSLVLGMRGGDGGPALSGDAPDAGGERVRVEVLNASGVTGLARAATDSLRNRGFDVVRFATASGFGPDTSWVLDRMGRIESAERVAEVLEIENVRTAVDTSLYIDVQVILGKDWVEDEAADSAAEGAGRAPGG